MHGTTVTVDTISVETGVVHVDWMVDGQEVLHFV